MVDEILDEVVPLIDIMEEGNINHENMYNNNEDDEEPIVTAKTTIITPNDARMDENELDKNDKDINHTTIETTPLNENQTTATTIPPPVTITITMEKSPSLEKNARSDNNSRIFFERTKIYNTTAE